MGLFDIFRGKQPAHPEVPAQTDTHSNGLHIQDALVGGTGIIRLASHRYADAYLWLVLSRIFAGLKNVRFTVPDRYKADKEMMSLVEWLDTTLSLVVWQYYNYGAVAVRIQPNGVPYFLPKSEWDVARDGHITNATVCVYSEQYLFERRSHVQILRENIGNLDRLKNAEDYLTTSLGALGILSAKNVPVYKDDREEFQRTMKKEYGITSDKMQILLFDSDVSFQQMKLPIEELHLTDKIKEEVKLIAGFFNVPYDLIPFSGASTYANQREAVRQFYSTCISPLAEVALKIGRRVMVHRPLLLVPSEALSFTFDNVPEIEDDRTTEIEYKTKVAELIGKMKANGLDTSKYEQML